MEESANPFALSVMLEDPRFWVLVAFVALLAMFGKKGWAALLNMLDGRSARIASELNEAKRLREEAEALLASFRTRQAATLQEAESMLQKARQDAEALAVRAQEEMRVQMQARAAAAEAKIAQAEKQALADVRDYIAGAVIAAAKKQIAAQMNAQQQDALLSAALADIQHTLH